MTDVIAEVIDIPIDPQHGKEKKGYLGVWAFFGAGLLAYTIYLVIKCNESYKSPGAKITVEPNQPPFPTFGICWDADDVVGNVTGYLAYTSSKDASPAYLSFGDPFSSEWGDTCIKAEPIPGVPHASGKLATEVEIYARASFDPVYGSRQAVDIYVIPSTFKTWDDTVPEQEQVDAVSMPAGGLSLVKWTVLQRKYLTGPLRDGTRVETHYQLLQQVEPLTKSVQKLMKELLGDSNAVEVNYDCADATGPCSYTVDSFTKSGTCVADIPTSFGDNKCAYFCNSSYVIPVVWVCDSEDDCPDGADEANCVGGLFTCLALTTESVGLAQKCDGIPDCSDGSDEWACSTNNAVMYAVLNPYTDTVTITEDEVTFGFESFWAALSAGFGTLTAIVAFLFPSEAKDYVRWRLRKEDSQEKKQEGPKDVQMSAQPALAQSDPADD